MTGGNSSSPPSLYLQPTLSGGWRLPAPEKDRVRPASNPYHGHWNRSTTGFGLTFRDGVVAVVVVAAGAATVGDVNSTSGCETLPGECARMNAAVAPTATSTTPAATSPRSSSRRETGLG